MNRHITADARKVPLGENSTLTLKMSEENPGELLNTLQQNYKTVILVFTNIDTDVTETVRIPFEVKVNKSGSATFLRFTGPAINGKKGLFKRLVPPRKEIMLTDKAAIALPFKVEAWEVSGAYVVEGIIYTDRAPGPNEPDVKAPTEKERAHGLDFDTTPLTVLETINARPLNVSLSEAKREESPDQLLWVLIRNRTVEFKRYRSFIDRVLCTNEKDVKDVQDKAQSRYLPFSRAASYGLLKYATELYLMQETGLVPNPDKSSVFVPGGQDPNVLLGGRLKLKEEFSRTRRQSINLRELRTDYLDQLEKDGGRVLPYFNLIRQKLEEVPLKKLDEIDIGENDVCYGILKSKLQSPPLIELLWSYYQEEGGLVQTLNAISLRFQNVRRPGPGPDPLANLNLDPLRPLSNLLWGYIEDERNRLTINRRNLEYQYEYGISLIGRAVQGISVAEHRTQFLRAFHDLLRMCIEFYQQANFTTVVPDGFPILNHLREVHLALAEGAHNQYGDLPWTARVEMLTQQWILARPEVREFLGGRIMVPYSEPWMDRVDNMKQLQGWNVTNITHFRDLAVFGEQLLLSIRYGSWNDPGVGGLNAANWAHYWREDIQRYVHAYKAVTGVDLANEVTDTRISLPANEDRYLQPAALIERQVALQQNGVNRTNLPPNRSAVRGQLGQPAQVVRRETYNNE